MGRTRAIKRALVDLRSNRRLKRFAHSNADRDALMSPRPVLASLAAFVGAGLRPQTALARAIVIVLAAKLIAVVAMTVYFNFADQHVTANAASISRLLGPASRP